MAGPAAQLAASRAEHAAGSSGECPLSTTPLCLHCFYFQLGTRSPVGGVGMSRLSSLSLSSFSPNIPISPFLIVSPISHTKSRNRAGHVLLKKSDDTNNT